MHSLNHRARLYEFHRKLSSRSGASLFSEETVKSHIGNILSKLHLAHRTQAALYALKQGLISLDELKL